MRTWIERLLTLVLAVTMAACGHGSTAPSPPASAAGIWLGTLGLGSSAGQPLGIFWDATETGNTGLSRAHASAISSR